MIIIIIIMTVGGKKLHVLMACHSSPNCMPSVHIKQVLFSRCSSCLSWLAPAFPHLQRWCWLPMRWSHMQSFHPVECICQQSVEHARWPQSVQLGNAVTTTVTQLSNWVSDGWCSLQSECNTSMMKRAFSLFLPSTLVSLCFLCDKDCKNRSCAFVIKG